MLWFLPCALVMSALRAPKGRLLGDAELLSAASMRVSRRGEGMYPAVAGDKSHDAGGSGHGAGFSRDTEGLSAHGAGRSRDVEGGSGGIAGDKSHSRGASGHCAGMPRAGRVHGIPSAGEPRRAAGREIRRSFSSFQPGKRCCGMGFPIGAARACWYPHTNSNPCRRSS